MHASLPLNGFVLGAALAALAAPAAAQCGPVTQVVMVADPGLPGCGPGAAPPVLKSAYDTATCGLEVAIDTPAFGFNVFLQSRVLIIGAQPASIQLPPALGGCTVHVALDLLLVNPAADDDWTFTVPPGALGKAAYAQGVNVWFDTFAFAPVPQLSAGYKVAFL